jgi:nucleoside-triphosphatase THEP1
MSIYIFSRPIHSGKTTELLQWCNQQKNMAGILMPDINGSRKIFDLQTKNIFDIECADATNTKEQLTVVGRFHFYTAAFEKANAIVLAALNQPPGWLVIDEAGKLELDGKGFYESIVKAVDLYNNDTVAGNLLIAVRESLCNEVISFFKIKTAQVIHQLEGLV